MSHNIPCSWQVPYETHEIRHQLEPGEERPQHTREGRIIDFLPHQVYHRAGPGDTITMCVVWQKIQPHLQVLPFTKLAVSKDWAP